jgi:hypothetical protein
MTPAHCHGPQNGGMVRTPTGCGELLDFDDVERRLQLGPRTDIGTQEIPIEQVIGSVGRAHEFDGCFRPRSARLRELLRQIRLVRPTAADIPILVYQVDHAYFVVDGHKRLALAIEDGRLDIDAEVSWFPSRFHVGRGTTIDDIRATELESRFRSATGLATAVPEARFELGDLDEFLELAESVKAHAYDLSRQLGRLVDPPEAARHWYDVVYRPAVELAQGSGLGRVLSSCSEAELFMLLRKGAQETMDHDWQMPASFAERGLEQLRRAEPRGVPAAIARVRRRGRTGPRVLPDRDLTPGSTDAAGEPVAPADRAAPPPTVVRRPRRERGTTAES